MQGTHGGKEGGSVSRRGERGVPGRGGGNTRRILSVVVGNDMKKGGKCLRAPGKGVRMSETKREGETVEKGGAEDKVSDCFTSKKG